MTAASSSMHCLLLALFGTTAFAQTMPGPVVICPHFDFTRRVDAREELPFYPLPQAEYLAAVDLNWSEMERWRVDTPTPPPPLVPAGLAGVFWALENPADAWRVIVPIPPKQAPRLVLPADACRGHHRSGAAAVDGISFAE